MLFGVTDDGFTLKRLYDILQDISADLALVQDPETGEFLTPDLEDENDLLVQIVNSVADQLATCWEQLELCYNQFDPLKATGAGQSALVLLNGLIRNLNESDTRLRIRQQLSTSKTSTRQVDAIFSAVISIPGVEFCKVYQNPTLDVDANGIPAKALAVVVVGGDDQAVADAIFNTAPAGIVYHGVSMLTCYDINDTPYEIRFSRPTAVPITVKVNLQITDSAAWPLNGADTIKNNIVAYSGYGLAPRRGIPPGSKVWNSRLYTPVNDVPGHDLVSIQLARDGGELAIQDITVSWNEVAQFTTDNISVVPV